MLVPTISKRKASSRAWLLSTLPGVVWELLFLLLPFGAILLISFLSRGEYGEIERPWTLENYRRLAGYGIFGFDPLYPMILLRSAVMAGLTAFLCVLASMPVAFFLASLAARKKAAGFTLLMIPVWTNLLVRTYAWQVLLAPEGLISKLFVLLGLISPGTALQPSAVAVYICLVCDYLPFAALPLYASVEKIDWSLAEAARDLGASGWNVFRHALFPQIRPGLIAGALLVFLPATGQFVIPDLLGGAKTVLLGNVLQQQFGSSRDWPFGSAVAAVAMLFVLIGLGLFYRLNKGKEALG